MANNKFRKIPEVVTAMQFDGANIEQLRALTGGLAKTASPPTATLAVQGRDLTFVVTDWIVSIGGKWEVMTDALFRKTYEPSEDV